MSESDLFVSQRRAMVERQIRARGVRDQRILDAMLEIPRHQFVPVDFVESAYSDQPITLGYGQTISQPYMVAAMTEACEFAGTERVLEVGAGSGYQAAILGRLTSEVIALEIEPALAQAASVRLGRIGFDNVRVITGDGSGGYPEAAPYDVIVVSAAARAVPQPLLDQLAEGGRLLIPVGPADNQELLRLRRKGSGFSRESLHHCRFVPLLGQHGQNEGGEA